MILAGKLTTPVAFERPTFGFDSLGVPIGEGFEGAGMRRAQIVEERHQREADDRRKLNVSTIVLRIRKLPGLALGYRMIVRGKLFEVKDFAPTEDGQGVEIIGEARA